LWFGDVRSEHPPWHDFGFDPDPLPAHSLLCDGEAAVERVETSAEPRRETDETLAAQPELQFDGRASPAFRYLRLSRETRRQRLLGPEVSQPDLLGLSTVGRKAPLLDAALSSVAPQLQLLDADLVTVQTLSLAVVHSSPYTRTR